jgi:hypothetical protein
MTESTIAKNYPAFRLAVAPVNKEHATMTTQHSRRAILAGAAALPALAVIPAMALGSASNDPIFAAIECHRAADAAFWLSPHGETDDEATERLERWSEPAELALADLLSTRPTTILGCVAVLRHLDHYLAEHEEPESGLLGNASDPVRSAGAGFLALIVDALAGAAAVQS